MRGKDQITDFAYGAMAAPGVSRMVARRIDGADRIGDRYRKTHMGQKRQIGNVVADESALGCGDIEFGRQFFERGNFVLAALNDMYDAQFRHSFFDGNRPATADDSHGYSGIKQTSHAVTVLGIECFRF